MSNDFTMEAIKQLPENLALPVTQTLIMVLVSTIGALILGIIPAVIVVVTKEGGLNPKPKLNKILDSVINVLRSLPFIILLVVVIPLTRILVGRATGLTGIIVPLTISAAPFVARIIENALNEVDSGLIEAAKSYGATDFTIVRKVMLVEAVPSLVQGITLTIISIIGYTAMAGIVAGGGIGDYAIRVGFQRGDDLAMFASVIILIILVEIVQRIGKVVYLKVSK